MPRPVDLDNELQRMSVKVTWAKEMLDLRNFSEAVRVLHALSQEAEDTVVKINKLRERPKKE